MPETEFQDEAAATFTKVAGWSRLRPQGPISTVTSQLSAWTKLGRGPGNLRNVGSLVGDRGPRRRRRHEQREWPTEWQVQGSPSSTGTVTECVWWQACSGVEPKRSAAKCGSGIRGGLRRNLRGLSKGEPRQPAKEHKSVEHMVLCQLGGDMNQVRRLQYFAADSAWSDRPFPSISYGQI